MIKAVEELGERIGVSAACRALGIARSGVYRARKPKQPAAPRPTPDRALSLSEKSEVRAVLNSERFCDCSPREVYATLLDEGAYYCGWRTMYRILAEHDEVHERRNQRQHPTSHRPQLRATGPNQLWSWDITELRGPNGVHYYLYTILDVFSRYVVGWMIALQESAQLARLLIAETCAKQGIEENQLTLHADRGSAMRSKSVAQLLMDLGVTKSHSRPYTPTDNPYSEAQFKTMKYRPDYPQTFHGIADARRWARAFFHWYNHVHHHTGLGLMTPATVHYDQVDQVRQQRQKVLDAAHRAHPERFVRGRPTPPKLPEEVWINPPEREHRVIGLADPAAKATQPGAQAGSRATEGRAQRSLDADQRQAMVEKPLDQPDAAELLFPKFQLELSQNA
jgi:transposase InsO family protein